MLSYLSDSSFICVVIQTIQIDCDIYQYYDINVIVLSVGELLVYIYTMEISAWNQYGNQNMTMELVWLFFKCVLYPCYE